MRKGAPFGGSEALYDLHRVAAVYMKECRGCGYVGKEQTISIFEQFGEWRGGEEMCLAPSVLTHKGLFLLPPHPTHGVCTEHILKKEGLIYSLALEESSPLPKL